MRLSFDSIEEVKEFVKGLKGTRGGKADADDEPKGQAPAPLQPPAGGMPNFAGPGAATGFPGGAGLDPALQAVVTRIVTKLDASLAAGNSAEAALTWFRSHFGPEAAQATLDQIKQVFLARLPVATLENIAKMMGA
jgi:hypothetical protein